MSPVWFCRKTPTKYRFFRRRSRASSCPYRRRFRADIPRSTPPLRCRSHLHLPDRRPSVRTCTSGVADSRLFRRDTASPSTVCGRCTARSCGGRGGRSRTCGRRCSRLCTDSCNKRSALAFYWLKPGETGRKKGCTELLVTVVSVAKLGARQRQSCSCENAENQLVHVRNFFSIKYFSKNYIQMHGLR